MFQKIIKQITKNEEFDNIIVLCGIVNPWSTFESYVLYNIYCWRRQNNTVTGWNRVHVRYRYVRRRLQDSRRHEDRTFVHFLEIVDQRLQSGNDTCDRGRDTASGQVPLLHRGRPVAVLHVKSRVEKYPVLDLELRPGRVLLLSILGTVGTDIGYFLHSLMFYHIFKIIN